MCFRFGSEDHFIANFPKPDTLDNKSHQNREKTGTLAYRSNKIDTTSENSRDKIESQKIYAPMECMPTNVESPRRNYGDSSQLAKLDFRLRCVDVVSVAVIWMVNLLKYLNYEAITCSSSTCHLFVQGASSGQTVSSYGWCNGIPSVVPVFSLFVERHYIWPSFLRMVRQSSMCWSCPQFFWETSLCLTLFLTYDKIDFHLSPLAYGICCSCGFCVSVRMYEISTSLHNFMLDVSTTVWFCVSTSFAHSCTNLWSILSRANLD